MAYPEVPKFECGDVTVVVKPENVRLEVAIKGATFRLTDEEARWLRDFLNRHVPKDH